MKKGMVLFLSFFCLLMIAGTASTQEQAQKKDVTPTACLQNLVRPHDYVTWNHTLISIDHGIATFVSRNPHPAKGNVSEITTYVAIPASGKIDEPTSSFQYTYAIGGATECIFWGITDPIDPVFAIF